MGTPYTRSYPLQLTPLPQDAKQIGGNLNQLGTEANAATLAICVAPSDFWATTMIQSASQVTKHSSVTQSATTIINAARKCTPRCRIADYDRKCVPPLCD